MAGLDGTILQNNFQCCDVFVRGEDKRFDVAWLLMNVETKRDVQHECLQLGITNRETHFIHLVYKQFPSKVKEFIAHCCQGKLDYMILKYINTLVWCHTFISAVRFLLVTVGMVFVWYGMVCCCYGVGMVWFAVGMVCSRRSN